ncbi:hypothetical protein L2U69_13045 [Zavarzinia compransoris]|uniref:MotE family protein n=1 Tax=Zavarzinia marina TaxID=2911065 RepID=UPI001F293C67|nr:hypothetical protein [Zavarzinia marina]MCF4166573.1 hypothetical protein [Zavarzinia marina]
MSAKKPSARRMALLPVVAGVAAAAFVLRLPQAIDAVDRALPRANIAMAAETPAPAEVPAEMPAESHDAATGTAPEPATETAAAPATRTPAFDPDSLTPGEIDVLQNLSRRRAEIEARARELDSREALIAAAEARVDEKLAEIKAIEEQIGEAREARSAEEDARLTRLVNVYETMKPVDAATIFNTLDFPVLIEVMSRMKERKVAPVLAAMDPEVAKALTVALATRKDDPQAAAPMMGSGG